jgi:hypothetical protein
MRTETKTKRIPSQRVLEAIAEGLEEIRAYFGWQVSFASGSTSADGGPDVEEDDLDVTDSIDGDDYGERDEEYFDREEVEVAVDAFISSLLASGVIRENRHGKPPSFGAVFARLFGDEGEVAVLAGAFEDDVKGYMGWIRPDEMLSAQKRFISIFNSVQEMLKETAHGR